MTIKDIKQILNDKQNQTDDGKLKNRIASLISDLEEYFGNSDNVDQNIEKAVKAIDSLSSPVDYNYIMKLNEAFISMKRRFECGQRLKGNSNKIDGETAQWITTIVQGVVGVASVILTLLFALNVFPNIFGGLSGDKDSLYYIIGTIGQQAVALVIAIIIGVVNRCRRNKKYKGEDFAFEELMAVKYAENPKTLWLLSPAAAKMSKCQIVIGNGNVQIEKPKFKAKSKSGDIHQSIKYR